MKQKKNFGYFVGPVFATSSGDLPAYHFVAGTSKLKNGALESVLFQGWDAGLSSKDRGLLPSKL